VVTKKDVTPKFEDLGPEIQKRWDAHEAAAKPPAPPPAPAAAPGGPAPERAGG
jgi:hypothetical protein